MKNAKKSKQGAAPKAAPAAKHKVKVPQPNQQPQQHQQFKSTAAPSDQQTQNAVAAARAQQHAATSAQQHVADTTPSNNNNAEDTPTNADANNASSIITKDKEIKSQYMQELFGKLMGGTRNANGMPSDGQFQFYKNISNGFKSVMDREAKMLLEYVFIYLKHPNSFALYL